MDSVARDTKFHFELVRGAGGIVGSPFIRAFQVCVTGPRAAVAVSERQLSEITLDITSVQPGPLTASPS